jgi:hypothetical protein
MFGMFKKPINYLLTGSFSVVFAACYGAPLDLQNPKRINAKDDNEQAIQGLKVTLFENRKVLEEKLTDENGSVEFYFVQKDKYNYSAKIEDIDGPDNLGQFNSEEINLNQDSFIELKLNKSVK